MVAIGEKGRQLGVVRAAPQRYHHDLRHLGRQRRAADGVNAVLDQVNAGGDTCFAVKWCLLGLASNW